MEKTDVLVIGGSVAGIIAAVTGKSYYQDKDFLLIRKEKKVLVPCGIPYIFGSLGSSDKDIIPDAVLTDAGIRLKIDEVISIDKKNKKCKTSNGTEISFEKLVLAIGSTPIDPKWLRGTNLENVFAIPKDKEYIDDTIAKLDGCNKIVTIGGGFIGVEIADELTKIGKNVTIVEILPHVLCMNCDEEITITVEEILKSRGIKIRTGVGAKEILGDKKVIGVLLDNGEKLETDAVILSLGYRPNAGLAEKSGIKINEMGFIKTDEFMRTDNPDFLQ